MSCTIVLGVYRSGTSAVAGILHKLGINMGEKLEPPGPSNPSGYFEDLEFKRLFRDSFDGHDVEPGLRTYIWLRQRHWYNWGVKDPQLITELSVLASALDLEKIPHRLVVCRRPVEEIGLSLHKAVETGMNDGVRAWAEHQSDPLAAWTQLARVYTDRMEDSINWYKGKGGEVLEVTFEEVVRHPLFMAQLLGRFCEIDLDRRMKFAAGAADFINPNQPSVGTLPKSNDTVSLPEGHSS